MSFSVLYYRKSYTKLLRKNCFYLKFSKLIVQKAFHLRTNRIFFANFDKKQTTPYTASFVRFAAYSTTQRRQNPLENSHRDSLNYYYYYN